MYKLRFNLSRGKNYKKWKIEHHNGDKEYYDPNDVQFILIDAKLKNYEKTAKKIKAGMNKTVCAWIICKEIITLPKNTIHLYGDEIKYNPRIKPYFDLNGNNVDNSEFSKLITNNNKIFIYEK